MTIYTIWDKVHGGTYTLCTFGSKTYPTLTKHETIWGGRTVDRMIAAGILRAAKGNIMRQKQEQRENNDKTGII